MSSQPHLKIFTSGQITHDERSNFPLFLLLPQEIRLKIWRHSLQRQRIIKLHLECQTEQTATEAAERTGFASKSERYCAVVDGYQVLTKLLRVNSESREAALNFFRVHLPCSLVGGATGEGTTRPGTLHFNPEYDFLHISSESPVKDTLVNFLYHLKTIHDPHRVGLLNLAMDVNGLNAHDLGELESSDLDSRVRTAFVETLTQLHEVFFVSTPCAGRQILGWQSGIETSETILNRSFPIMAMAPTFERLHRDPRPIAHDLRQVFVGTSDPRGMLHLWRQLLKRWGVSPPQIEYRFYLAFTPISQGDQIYDRGSAIRWLQKEDDAWTKPWEGGSAESSLDQDQEKADKPLPGFSIFFKMKNMKIRVGALSEKYRNEDLEKAVKPAFGFWLFPVEALGALPEEGLSEDEGFYPKPNQILDMTEHWPELALFSLS